MGGRGVLVGMLTMFVRRHGVLLRFLVLAEIVMMRGLVMMMRGGVVMGGGLMMMLARRMLRSLPWGCSSEPALENSAGCSLDMGRLLLPATPPLGRRAPNAAPRNSAWARQRKTLDLLDSPRTPSGFPFNSPWIFL